MKWPRPSLAGTPRAEPRSGGLGRLAAGHELVELRPVLGRPELLEEADEGVALLLEALQRLLAVAVEGGVAGAPRGAGVVVVAGGPRNGRSCVCSK